MHDRYQDLIEQSFEWPAYDFKLKNNSLHLFDVDLLNLLKSYGSPLRISYLPKIKEQIEKARFWFNSAFDKTGYEGNYTYCYCTKSSHFSFVLKTVLQTGAQLETSSAYDLHLIEKLFESGHFHKSKMIVCNGYKRPHYLEKISELRKKDYRIIPVLDNLQELDSLLSLNEEKYKIGIRIATEEEPQFEFYTSRLGIRYKDILDFYLNDIKPNSRTRLTMLHFFVNTGIRDSAYYWSELRKCLHVYCELKNVAPELDYLDIGGGFPIPQSLKFEFDYSGMIEQIVSFIKEFCRERGVKEPNLITEFGNYTVAESSANFYSVLGVKQQNDREKWYMTDNSFMTTLPDVWGLGQRFLMLPVNKWNKKYQQVNLGGLTCDSMDYYNSEVHANNIYLPEVNSDDDKALFIGFFNTGAYQDSLSGYGGIKHCLIPAPRHLVIDRDEDDKLKIEVFREEQSAEGMLEHLGY